MVAVIEEKQIDYVTKEATRKTYRNIPYHCITCQKVIRANQKIMPANTIERLVPSTIMLNRDSKKAYLKTALHVAGSPFSKEKEANKDPVLFAQLTTAELNLLGQLTVCPYDYLILLIPGINTILLF
jgi:hypothetical protein